MTGFQRMAASEVMYGWLRTEVRPPGMARWPRCGPQLAAIDSDIDGAVRSCPAWREAENLLTSAPGVGDVTARTLPAELPELGRPDRRAIAALVGVGPINRSRWSREGGGKSLMAPPAGWR
jgi:transposase